METSTVLANPRLPKEAQKLFPSAWKGYYELPKHVWMATSGTSRNQATLRWVALSQIALEASAAAVNQRFHCSSSDVWLNPLPLFHIGGFSIQVRAQQVGAKVLNIPWSVETFMEHLPGVTLTSLVPAQLFDLVSAKKQPTSSLRVVVVGGAALALPLYEQAVALGWPICRSYGMTETASQIATAQPKQWQMQLLPHFMHKIDEEQRLWVKGASLLTGYLKAQEGEFTWQDPKQEGWFCTQDLVKGEGEKGLEWLGRSGHWVKIGGENVSLGRLQAIWQRLSPTPFTLLEAIEDARLGHQIVLKVEGEPCCQAAVDCFNEEVMPYERIRQVIPVAVLPKTALGKVLF